MSEVPSPSAVLHTKHLETFKEKLQIIRDRVTGVAERYHSAAYIVGRSGTSKTFTVAEHLDSLDRPWIQRNARMSALGLFDLFAEHPEHIIVLDDVPSLFRDRQALQILMPALDGDARRPRTITYKTRDGDERVEFTGGVIALSNLELKRDPLADALASRVVILQHEPTDDEIRAFARELAGRGFGDLSADTCLEVLEFVCSETRLMDRRLDLRHLIKAWEDRRQWRDGKAVTHWTTLVRTGLQRMIVEPEGLPSKRDEIQQQREAVRLAVQRFPDDRKRQMADTGLRKSTYYARLRELKLGQEAVDRGLCVEGIMPPIQGLRGKEASPDRSLVVVTDC